MLDSASFREPPIESLSSHQVAKLAIDKKKELDKYISRETKIIEDLKKLQGSKALNEKHDIVIKYDAYMDKVSNHIFVKYSRSGEAVVKKIIPFGISIPIEPSRYYAVLCWSESTGKISFTIVTNRIIDMTTETVENTKNSLFYAFPDSGWTSRKLQPHLRISFKKIQELLDKHYIPGINAHSMEILSAWVKSFIQPYIDHVVKVKETSKKFGL